MAKFKLAGNNTTTDVIGSNCRNVFELTLILDKSIALSKSR